MAKYRKSKDEEQVLALMHRYYPPSAIDRKMGRREGFARETIVGLWAKDRERRGGVL